LDVSKKTVSPHLIDNRIYLDLCAHPASGSVFL
jgi:hypothetical protein